MTTSNVTKTARELRKEGFHRIGTCRQRYYVKEVETKVGTSVIEIYQKQGVSRNYELRRKLVCIDEVFR